MAREEIVCICGCGERFVPWRTRVVRNGVVREIKYKWGHCKVKGVPRVNVDMAPGTTEGDVLQAIGWFINHTARKYKGVGYLGDTAEYMNGRDSFMKVLQLKPQSVQNTIRRCRQDKKTFYRNLHRLYNIRKLCSSSISRSTLEA